MYETAARTAAGQHVLDQAVAIAGEVFGSQLVAAYTLGSLAHGGFAPLVSDVDVALILDRLADDTRDRIAQVNHLTRLRSDQQLAQRLSVFWTDWQHLQVNEEAGRFPAVDRLDLALQGRLLWGVDRRQSVKPPAYEDLVLQAATMVVGKFTTADYVASLLSPETLIDLGLRPVTKAVLFPVRFLYTAATGKVAPNDAAIHWYVASRGAASKLASATRRWREQGLPPRSEVAEYLQEGLVPLHLELVERYLPLVARYRRPDLAVGLESLPPALVSAAAKLPIISAALHRSTIDH